MDNKNKLTIDTFSTNLKNYYRSIEQLLQRKYGISAEEFYITCLNAVKKTPKLLTCDPRSLFGAILLCAEVGLKPNTPDQHAFIIPYSGEAKFQIGYKGLIEIMYRNPRVLNINAVAVYEKDEFDYGYGLNPFLNHKPYRGKDRGKLKATYCVVKLKDAEPIFTVVEDYELVSLKEFSQAKNSEFSPYNSGADVFNFMEIKASVKKISKLIPKQGISEIAKAVEYDSKFEGGASVTVPLLSNNEKEVTPKLMDKPISSSILGAFDDFEDVPIKKEKEPLKVDKKPKVIKKTTENTTSKKNNAKNKPKNENFDNEIDFSTAGETIEPIQNKKK